MKELWMDVIGYEGRYKISNLGRFMSLFYGDARIRRLSKVSIKKDYNQIALIKEGRSKTFRVARLVLIHFNPIDNPEEYQANHINGIRSDDRISNLEWTTCKENIHHAWKTGLAKSRKGKLNTQSKRVVVKNITGDFVLEFDSIGEAARHFNVYKTSLMRCCSGKSKTFIPERGKRFIINYL